MWSGVTDPHAKVALTIGPMPGSLAIASPSARYPRRKVLRITCSTQLCFLGLRVWVEPERPAWLAGGQQR
jgi:hypothetical protein